MNGYNPNTVINSINKEFALLLEEEVLNKWWCKKDLQNQEILETLRVESRFTIPYKGKKVTINQYDIICLLEEIEEFWDKNRDAYLNAIKNISGLTLLNGSPLKHGLYFDTIILEDTFSFHLRNPDRHKGIIGAVFSLRVLVFDYMKLLKVDSDKPVIAINIAPKQDEADIYRFYEESKEGHFSSLVFEKSEFNTLRIFNEISRIDQSKLKTTLEWRRIGDLGEINLSVLFDLERLLEIIDMTGISMTAKENVWEPFWAQVNEVINGERVWVDGVVYKWFLKWIYGLIYAKEHISNACHNLHTDPYINDLKIYKFWLQLEAENTINQFKLERELSVPLILDMPNINWIGTVSITDVIRFREKGGASFLKDVFEKHYKKIKYSKIDALPKCLEEASSDLSNTIREYNIYIQKSRQKLKRDIFKSGLSFSTTLALGMASVFAPPLGVISIPAAIFSLLIGGKSAKDLINGHLSGNKKIKELRDRPIGILADYIDDNG